MRNFFLLFLCFCAAVNTENAVPTCPKYPSCTWAQEIDGNSCSGLDGENVCPGGKPLCVNLASVAPSVEGTNSSSCCCLISNPDTKHLEQGAAKPPLKDRKLRMYFMRFCPYCHRVALVSSAKRIQTDIVFVNLRNNPDWFTQNSTLGGFVPTVETKDGHFNGSLIVSDFLDETYPMPGELYPCNTFVKGIDRVFIDNFNRITPALFYAAFKNSSFVPAFEENLIFLGDELEKRGTPYFAGKEKAGMVDYMIWPWIERKPVLQMKFPNSFDYNSTDHRISEWTELMKKDKAIISYGLSPQVYYAFFQSILQTNDTKPNYNILV